jgi:7-carboxy-7-deazaguanine synthase
VSRDAKRPEGAVLHVSELFSSVQGEGPSAGKPCLFLRLAHCNLRCRWCDTRYSWDFQRYRFEEQVTVEVTEALAQRIAQSAPERLVITGGEPLIQWRELERLVARLPEELAIEIETNGTLAPSDALVARVNQWNVSPKLANSGDPAEKRVVPAALSRLRESGRAYLKLVVNAPDELAEAEAVISESAWPRERVMLMAQAATRAELTARGPLIRAAALTRGLGYSPRLHVELWDGARGK